MRRRVLRAMILSITVALVMDVPGRWRLQTVVLRPDFRGEPSGCGEYRHPANAKRSYQREDRSEAFHPVVLTRTPHELKSLLFTSFTPFLLPQAHFRYLQSDRKGLRARSGGGSRGRHSFFR